VRVPGGNLIGKEGDGFKQALQVLDGGRIGIAALSVGLAQGALDASVKYAKDRHQFGKPLSDFQAIQFKLADMATEIEAARLLTRKAAFLKMQGENYTLEAAQAKYFASEVATRAANEAVQIHGGYGFIKEYPVEKFYRDVKLLTIGEGTSEVQKMVIARALINDQ
jgi:alkylation response protein AidB-like acyl-CoA dehydrogenase